MITFTTHSEAIKAGLRRSGKRAGPAARLAAERFWPKVDKAGACWLWVGAKNVSGHGRFQWAAGEIIPAHQAVLRLSGTEIPPGMVVCHHCDNPPCVNPAHLFIGTQRDNLEDMTKKGRRKAALGEAASATKTNVPDVLEMRRMYATGVGYRRIGKAFGLHPCTVRAIVLRRTWRHV